MVIKKGWATVAKANKEDVAKGEFASFKSGETRLVMFKSLDDVYPYFSYGVFGKVNTFIPKEPATFNDKGFVESNATPWDLASQHYYDLSKKDKPNEKALKNFGYMYSAKQRFMIAVYDVETGTDIIVDLTANQAGAVLDSLTDYADTDAQGNFKESDEHDFLGMVFKLAKKGSGTKTVVTLSPIINVQKGLSSAELAFYEAETATAPIADDVFEGLLFELDKDDMLRGLVKCDFDLSIIGETTPPPKEVIGATDSPDENEDPTDDF